MYSRDYALIDPTADIAEDVKIWHQSQVRENAVIGAGSTIGSGAYIGSGVKIGDNCKIQNNALLYEPAIVESGVFIGPAVVFTNDHNPRATTPDGQLKSLNDWIPVGVTVHEGASIGAGAICVAPLSIGRWAMIAAGSVVIRDVHAFALVAGNPARQIGWVGKAGCRLVIEKQDPTFLSCPKTGERYLIGSDGELIDI